MSALTITQTESFPTTDTDISASQSGLDFLFSATALADDPSAPAPPPGEHYTLTGVTIDVAIVETLTSLDVSNPSTVEQTSTFTIQTDLGVTGDAAPSDMTFLTDLLGNPITLYPTTMVDLAPSGSETLVPLGSPVATTADATWDSTNVPFYAGAGTFDIAYSTLTGELIEGGGGNLSFTVKANSSDTVSVIYNYALTCFLEGTRLLTDRGEVAVEELKPGDMLVTFVDGEQTLRPARWIGRQVVSRRFADPVRVLPIRIRAGALSENEPARDLLVSPGHGILMDNVMVHAGALVNGLSIVREDMAPPTFTYYHVEVDAHCILLAERAPVESYLEGVDDLGYENLAERVPPDAVEELPYPRAKASRQVPRAIRMRLAERAAMLVLVARRAA